ncbi:hypothetical protein ACPA54_05105 [Uniformispora flossi]|uniref:hypothetical protein n=1 Tax=Uniformispora flossi TaxID=3390723 RepID=UPI003C2CF330
MTDTPTSQEGWLPPALLRAVWAQPGRLAEVMALFAVRHLGAGAAASAHARLESRDGRTDAELDDDAVRHGTLVTVTEGAFVGGPFLVFIPVAFCAALLGQARMVLEIAALHGRDTRSDARAADLLVLQGAYPDTLQAGAALAAVRAQATATPDPVAGEEPEDEPGDAPGEEPAAKAARPTDQRPGEPGDATETGGAGGAGKPGEGRKPGEAGKPAKPRLTERFGALMRMAAVLGLITPEPGPRGRLRRILSWVYVAALIVVGFVVPLVWIPAMGYGYKRATPALGRRAVAYYTGAAPDGGDSAPLIAGRGFDPIGVVTFIRTLVAAAVPLAAVGFVVLADIRIGDSNIAAAGVAIVVATQVAAAAWVVYRLRKRHRTSGR